jgi:tetratricopeptide (TPR) repeat protein
MPFIKKIKEDNSQIKKSDLSRKILLNLILISLPIILIALIELSLRLFGYGSDLRLFKQSKSHEGFMEVNQMVGKRYFNKLEITKPAYDIFLINKPDSCYRIFVMGESAAMGFPYEIGISFSRILKGRLQDAFPRKQIEVINTAMTAVNSYTMLDFTDEILRQKPDAIIIYTGHNEYYGALGVGSVENGGNIRWLKQFHLKLIHFRIYQLIQHFISAISKSMASNDTHQRETLMERIAKDKEIEYGSKLYYAGAEQFRNNMRDLLIKAKSAGVSVIISDLACNVHDMKPFKSITSSGKYPNANQVFDNARALEAIRDYDNAKNKYYEAKDLDAIRFRASEDINIIIKELGNKYNALVVPMKSYFEQHSPHNLIGNNLMTEHLHPNVDGYFLMADVFFNTMRNAKMIDNNWDSTLIKPSSYYRNNWGFTALDSLFADLKIKKLKAGWPFQSDTVTNRFKFTYKPKSVEDSMAFQCLKYTDITIDKMHEKMAIYYSDKGNFYKAFREYYSLIKCYPYKNELYLEGFNYLMKAKKYNEACALLKSMPGIDTTYYALIQIGKIYLDQTEFDKAIYYIEKADKCLKSDDETKSFLYFIYNAYIKAGFKEKAAKVAMKISTFNPQFKPSTAAAPKVQIFVLSEKAKKYIETAKTLAMAGNLDKALDLLYKANEIKENSYVNLIIGNILFQKKDTLALDYFEKVYVDRPKDQVLLDKLCILYIVKHDLKNASRILNEFKLVTTDQARTQKLSELIEKDQSTRK